MQFTVITEQERQLPFYVTGIGIRHNQEPVNRPNGLCDFQWTYCTKGEGIFQIGDKEYVIHKGMGFFFFSKIPHKYKALQLPWETNWITFNGLNISYLLGIFNIGLWEVFSPECNDRILELFQKIDYILRQDNLDKVIETSTFLYELLINMRSSIRFNESHPINQKFLKLKPVISHMENYYNQTITLEELASIIHVTTHYLCKLFKAAFGLSPIHYLARLRMQIAKSLLIQFPEQKIKEIAEKVGYNDTSYFIQVFKEHEKVTPIQFRRLYSKV